MTPLASIAAAVDTDGFAPVDPAALEAVSGSALVIACYCVITGLLALYALLLFVRERSLSKRIRMLKRSITNTNS